MPVAEFRLRKAEEILAGLAARCPQREGTKRLVADIAKVAPGDYRSALERLGECTIAADFEFLGPRRLREENDLRQTPAVELGTAWWLFSVSGSGDGWLVRRSGGRSEVAFLDHDEETSAKARALGISFTGWLVLADLMSQVERASETDPGLVGGDFALVPGASRLVRDLMDGIGKNLSKRYPFAL